MARRIKTTMSGSSDNVKTTASILGRVGVLEGALVTAMQSKLINTEMGVPKQGGDTPETGFVASLRVMVCAESLTADKKYTGRLVLHGTGGWNVNNNDGWVDHEDSKKVQANFIVDLTQLKGVNAGAQDNKGFYINPSQIQHKKADTVNSAITLSKHSHTSGGSRGEVVDNMVNKFSTEGIMKAAKTVPCQLKLDYKRDSARFKLFGRSMKEVRMPRLSGSGNR